MADRKPRRGAKSSLEQSQAPSDDDTDPSLSYVLVIVTGGTITMENKDGVLVPSKDYLNKVVRRTPVLNDPDFHPIIPPYMETLGEVFVLPQLTKTKTRVVYVLYEYKTFIDSSNMSTKDYQDIARDIEKNYLYFDGFVVVQGTDTMAYTASYLSFMLQCLQKSVVLTGAQVPLCATRNDGVDNLLGAILMAGIYVIPEVTLFFHDTLYRGNRVRKMNSESFAAYESPNMEPLASLGVHIQVNQSVVWRSDKGTFSVQTDLEDEVGVLRLFPSITAKTVKAFLSSMKGVVLQTYGAGNGPSDRKDLMEEIKKANDRGVLLLNCTQCAVGCVTDIYETGDALVQAGVVPGLDLTPEAGLSKLSYVLGQRKLSFADKKKLLAKNLRGEMTKPTDIAQLVKRSEFFEAIENGMQLSTKSEREGLRNALFPSLICFSAKNDDTKAIEALVLQGADVRTPDHDGRTALHVAATHGNYKTVQYLLGKGASLFAKDVHGKTPLQHATTFKHDECVKLLVDAGGHDTSSALYSAKRIKLAE